MKGWTQINVRFGPVSDIKVCNKHGRYSIEVQSLFRDQTESWIRIVNGIEKLCQRSHANPRLSESFGETRCKRKTNTETVINESLGLYSYWTETMDWHWNTGVQGVLIVFKCQNSLLDYFDTVNKFVENKMEKSIATKLLENARKSFQTIQDTCQTKCCSISPMLRIGHLKNGYQVWRKVEDRRKGSSIAWTRTILRNSCTLEQSKDIQEVQSILHCKTMYCYPKVSPSKCVTTETEKELRSIVNHGLIPGGVGLKTGRHAVFFTVVNPMDNRRWLRVNPYATCPKQESRHTKILENTFRIQYFGAIWSSLEKEDWKFIKQDQTLLFFYDTLPAEFIERAICMKTKDQLHQWEGVILRQRVVLKAYSQSGSQDLLVQEARSSWESQQDAESTEKPEVTLLTIEYQVYRSQRWKCRMHGDKTTSQNLSRCSKNIGIRNNSLKTCVKSRRDTGSARNHNNYSSTWTPQRSSNFARTLQNFNVLIAIPLRKSGIICAVAGEIWSTSGVLQQTRRRITTVLQSVALSGPKHGNLNDKSCSSRRRRCLRKQDSKSTGTIQRFSHGGMVHRRKVPRFVGGAQYSRERNYALRSHRSWTTWFFSYTSWTTTERQTLGSSFECWWAPETSSTATKFCRRIKTLPENARCSLGGDRTNSDTDTSTTVDRTPSQLFFSHTCTLSSFLYLHLLLHHHHRIQYLMSTDTQKIQYKKEVEVRVESFWETRCMKPQKPETKIKMENPKKYKEIYRMSCLIG